MRRKWDGDCALADPGRVRVVLRLQIVGVAIPRVQMHGYVMHSRSDTACVQARHERIARDATGLLVDQQRVEMPRMDRVAFGRRLASERQCRKGSVITIPDFRPSTKP